MATYLELRGLYQPGTDLANRVDVAVIVAAELIRNGDDDAAAGFSEAAGAHDLRKAWAPSAFTDTGSAAAGVLKAVLAQNRTATVAQIEGSTDATLQSAVNKAVDLLAGV